MDLQEFLHFVCVEDAVAVSVVLLDQPQDIGLRFQICPIFGNHEHQFFLANNTIFIPIRQCPCPTVVHMQ
jgi:hypothetical protein